MIRVQELWALHDDYNARYFAGKLNFLTILIKKSKRLNGYYLYASHKDDTPIRERLHKAVIAIMEGCWEEGSVEATLLHEMVHQYQCEILNLPPHHDSIFKSICRAIERQEDVGIIR